MNHLQSFMYESHQVRTVFMYDQPWFIAKDVCDVLEISNSRDALSRLDQDEKGVVSTDTLGGRQEVSAVNEPGLYSLILGSRKPEAKQFKRWVTHEVIPSIRKHGAYITPEAMEKTLQDPDYIIGVITALKNEKEQRKVLQQQINEDRPKVVFADALEASKDSILIGQLATILKQNGINIGQNRLFKYMRDNGYLCKTGERYNLPTQRSMNLGILETQVRIVGGGENIKRRETPKVPGKGQKYFINLLKKAGGLD